jgi:hypothetical protein
MTPDLLRVLLRGAGLALAGGGAVMAFLTFWWEEGPRALRSWPFPFVFGEILIFASLL